MGQPPWIKPLPASNTQAPGEWLERDVCAQSVPLGAEIDGLPAAGARGADLQLRGEGGGIPGIPRMRGACKSGKERGETWVFGGSEIHILYHPIS